MQYEQDDKTRLQKAKELAGWLVNQLPAETPITVVDRGGRQRGQDLDHEAAELRIERLEASALRQEQLMARLADVLVPWTEIFPKGRLATGTLRRPSASKPTSLTSVGHSA